MQHISIKIIFTSFGINTQSIYMQICQLPHKGTFPSGKLHVSHCLAQPWEVWLLSDFIEHPLKFLPLFASWRSLHLRFWITVRGPHRASRPQLTTNHVLNQLAKLMKSWTSLMVVGMNQDSNASTFPASILIPSALMWYPRNWVEAWWNVHFSTLRYRWHFQSFSRTGTKCWRCSARFWEYTRMCHIDCLPLVPLPYLIEVICASEVAWFYSQRVLSYISFVQGVWHLCIDKC